MLPLLVVLAGCRATGEDWGRSSRVLYESEELQIRCGRALVDREAGEIVLRWVGAQSAPGAPQIREAQIVVFEDKDRDGEPGPGERRAANTVRETTDKVLFSSISVPFDEHPQDIKARLTVWTEARRKQRTWRLVKE